MPEFEMQSSRRQVEARPDLVVVSPDESSSRTWLEAFRLEFDGYYGRIRTFEGLDPDQVMLEISAMAGRLTEVRALLLREHGQRANRLRLDEVDPLLEQLEFQFKIHSRLQSVRDLDFRLSGGQV